MNDRSSERTNERERLLTFASSVPTSVYKFVNSTCMGCIGGVSFGGVTRESDPGVRGGVPSTLFALEASVVAPGIVVTGKFAKGSPVAGARGSLGMVPETAGGFVPRRKPGMGLESGAVGGSTLGPGFGMRLNAPGLIPGNRLGATVVTGFAASSAVDFVSGFTAAPSEKPLKSSVGTGGVVEEEGLLWRGTPFVVNSGSVFGIAIVDDITVLVGWSTTSSILA